MRVVDTETYLFVSEANWSDMESPGSAAAKKMAGPPNATNARANQNSKPAVNMNPKTHQLNHQQKK